MGTSLRLGIAVIVLAASACVVRQEQETPPEPVNDREPTQTSEAQKTTGSSSGGSSSGGSAPTANGAIDPSALAACHEMCDYEVSRAKDCTADAASQCKALCKIVLQAMDAKCQDTAAQWSTCMKTNVDPTTLTCNGGNLPQATMPAACEAITNDYVACTKQK